MFDGHKGVSASWKSFGRVRGPVWDLPEVCLEMNEAAMASRMLAGSAKFGTADAMANLAGRSPDATGNPDGRNAGGSGICVVAAASRAADSS